MMQGGSVWSRLPQEMQELDQWCIAGSDKAPLVSGKNGLYNASPVKGPWLNFNEACQLAIANNTSIGFIITKEDPFTCIDLDIKDASSKKANGSQYPSSQWTSQSTLNVYKRILLNFQSYGELSLSGKGLHVWVKGAIGEGARRLGAEVYSQERFIVCTGNSLSDIDYHIKDAIVVPVVANNTPHPITPKQEFLDILVAEMRSGAGGTKIDLKEVDEELTDQELVERAMNASNADKFNNLCKGSYGQYNYPSQSEADLSLMSMFTFYSKSNEQCRRLFRYSELGKREKAIKNDVYLDRTLKIIRSRMERHEVVENSLAEQAKALVDQLQKKPIQKVREETKAIIEQGEAEGQTNVIKEAYEQPYSTEARPDKLPKVDGLEWPPGMAGALAAFIYKSAPRPVKEVAIVAALGLLAGITGKAFHISQSGLNLYLILVARSAIGKEAMHSGISLILDKIRDAVPSAQNFVDFADFASGPALVKATAENPSFVNITGEWGRKLRRLSNEDGREGPMQQLRTVMTNLYQKSGPSSVVGGLSYSNKEQNIASVSGVAYSMIGETTPGTFYDALTDSMMEDGFLSRFTIIEYTGERPASNKNPILVPDDRLTEALCGLVTQSLTLLSRYQNIQLEYSVAAKKMLDDFDAECDKQINSTDDEGWRQMWNRGHLKTIRIAGVLAASDNYVTPVIHENHVKWALDLVKRDISIMSKRMGDGDIGQGDPAREKKLLSIIGKYLKKVVPASYNVPDKLRKDGIVPRRYLQVRTCRVSAFTSHRLGTTAGLDMALRSLCDSGYVMECDHNKTMDLYGPQGKCFRVLNLPAEK